MRCDTGTHVEVPKIRSPAGRAAFLRPERQLGREIMTGASPGEWQFARGPLVSIVLPTYDRQHYLAATIASIFSQSFEDWELIIADDGSAAPTRAYLATLQHSPKVRLLWLAHSGRPAVARNAALREARGDYIAFMDSDDVWMPSKLERQLASLRQRTDCKWGQTSFLLTDAVGNPVRQMTASDGWIFKRLLRGENIALPSVLMSRSLLDEVGGFDETLVTCEDYELWIRCAMRSPVAAIAEPLTRVRRHQEHYGHSAGSVHDCIRIMERLLHGNLAVDAESLVRRRLATLWAHLARVHAVRGERASALSCLLQSAPFSCRYPGWWLGALGVTAWVVAPSGVRNAIRRARDKSRSRRSNCDGTGRLPAGTVRE